MTFLWKGEKTIHFVQMKLHKTRKEPNISVNASSSKAGLFTANRIAKTADRKEGFGEGIKDL